MRHPTTIMNTAVWAYKHDIKYKFFVHFIQSSVYIKEAGKYKHLVFHPEGVTSVEWNLAFLPGLQYGQFLLLLPVYTSLPDGMDASYWIAEVSNTMCS